MEQVTQILTDWYHNGRWIYAGVTVSSVLVLGLLAAAVGSWLARWLGIRTHLANGDDRRA